MSQVDKINIAITEINSYLHDYRAEVSDIIVNEKVARDKLLKLEIMVRSHLVKIFGKEKLGSEKYVSDLGLTGDVLKYRPKSNDDFSDAVIASYWSRIGERNIYLKEEKGKWRENFFYKGTRWSSREHKEKFYEFFKFIEESVEGNTAVKLLSRVGVKNKIFNFCVTCEGQDAQTHTIRFPNTDELLGIEIPALSELLNIFKEWKVVNSYAPESRYEEVLRECTYEKIKTLVNSAFDQIMELKPDVVRAWVENITSKLGVWESADLNKEVFCAVVSYQYYDIPYDIHFYLPEIDPELRPPSFLLVTTSINNNEIGKYDKSFQQLSNAINEFAVLEEEIWEKWRNNLPTYWHWKNLYEEWEGKYERLSELGINICRAICNKKNIHFVYTPHRVKDFDSFYNKIVSIANTPLEKEPKSIKFNIAVNRGRDEDVKYIFSELRDIAGARIVCIYNDDVEKIIKELDALRIKGEISFNREDGDVKEWERSADDPGKTNTFDYRSYHVTFTLDENRLKLYEYNDLRGLKCEIQIRTMLADGWANASHELAYKPLYCPSDLLPIDFDSRMNSISASLYNYDLQLVQLRRDIEKGFDNHYQ